MPTDLDAQVRDYAAFFVSESEPVDLDELDDLLWQPVGTGAVRPLQPLPFRRPLRGWIYAAAAVVVVLLLVGGAAFLFGVVESDAPVATTPPTDVPTSFTWSRVPHDEGVFGDKVPFTGGMSFKQSGFGKDLSEEAVHDYTVSKHVAIAHD